LGGPEAQFSVTGLAKGYLVTVMPGLWVWHHRPDLRIFDPANSLQLVFDDRLFMFQLSWIINVLEMAATTRTEVWTGWLKTMWRGFQHLQEPAAGKSLLVLNNTNGYFFARYRKGHEYHPLLIVTAEGGSAIGHIRKC
jgi:hypothetical protein